MNERDRLERELAAIQSRLDDDQERMDVSVAKMIEAMRNDDENAVMVDAEFRKIIRDGMQTNHETATRLHRRLEALTIEELTRQSIATNAATAKATWAMFWVALFAMFASTTATLVAAYIATRP